MRSKLARMPWSQRWFALAGAVYVLQVFPATGGVLTFMAALYWSVITINLGFASIVPEALFGRIAKTWLVLPVLWFGGYFTAAYLSHAQVAALDAQFRAHNAAERTPFDPTTNALVLDSPIFGISHRGVEIARAYRIPVVYTNEGRGSALSYRANRLIAEPECQSARQNALYRETGILVQSIYEEEGDQQRARPNRFTPSGICALTLPEAPTLPAILVEVKREVQGGFLAPHDLYRLTIRDADGKELAQPLAGDARPLKWFPMPILGCGLVTMRGWDCTASFMREHVGLGGDKAFGEAINEAIATSLGLDKSHALSRRAEIAAAPKPSIAASAEELTARALAVLASVLADPTKRDNIQDIRVLGKDVSLFRDHAPTMVQAISRQLANGRRSFMAARELQVLLMQLPRADFQAIGPAIIDALSPQDTLNSDSVNGDFAARLGDLGPAAVPILQKMIFPTSGRRIDFAIYGFCRMSAPTDRDAAKVFDRAVDKLVAVAETKWSEATLAVYVTLKRQDREDLIERAMEQGAPFDQPDMRLRMRSISPRSPPSACTNNIRRPSLPD